MEKAAELLGTTKSQVVRESVREYCTKIVSEKKKTPWQIYQTIYSGEESGHGKRVETGKKILKKKIQDFVVGYGKDEHEKEILKNMYRLKGFTVSTDAQLLPIRQLELFKERGKYENDPNMTEADKKAKLAEIDAKLADLAKQMK